MENNKKKPSNGVKQNPKSVLPKVFLSLAIAGFFLFTFQSVFAQIECPPGSQPGTCGPGQCEVGSGASAKCVIANPSPKQLVDIKDFGELLALFIKILLGAAGAIAVIFLIIGGFRYVTAQGNEEGTEKAKKTITGAIIGIVIIVLAFAIVAIVNNLLVNPPAQ